MDIMTEDVISPRAGVRFEEPADAKQQMPSDMDFGNSTATSFSSSSQLCSSGPPSRGIVFRDEVTVQEIEVENDGMGKKKSQFARFFTGDVGSENAASPIRLRTRKTLTNMADNMRARKSMGIISGGGGKSGKQGRYTVGSIKHHDHDHDDSAEAGPENNIENKDPSSITSSERRGRNATEPHLTRGVSKKRSRSMSRGPRRGRDRFRGVGQLFSTSAARNAPRPPRTTIDEDIPAGTSSKTLLKLLHKKRMVSPSPDRASSESSDRRSDLLKCRSADVEQVLREAQK